MAYLRRHLPQAADLLRTGVRELSVALVGDKRMGQLHEQFMGLTGPTDVLTFPIDEGAGGRVTSGEVVVCVPEARRQARRTGNRVEKELLLYALHGLLHLGGFDDRTDAGYQKMHRTEDQILTRLGVGAVFDPPPRCAAKRDRRQRGAER